MPQRSTKLTLLLLVFLVWLPGVKGKPFAPAQTFAFTHVTVIDTLQGRIYSDATVVIQGNLITAVGKTGKVPIPKDVQVVDATGKFLIPGLWDMHFHTPEDKQAREIFYPLAIANGVTGVRNMFGAEDLLKHRAEVNSGTLHGPRMIVGSPVVDGPTPMWPGSIPVADANAGRQAVRTLKQRGYDFIKTYQFLSRETYLAIADEAKKQNIPFAGHVPFSLSAAEASDAGQKTFEHIFGVSIACATDEATLRPALADASARVANTLEEHFALFIRNEAEALAGYDQLKATALFKRMAKNDTYAVPTLVLHQSLGLGPIPPVRNDSRLRYMPSNIKLSFTWELGLLSSHQSYQPVYERLLSMTGLMHRTGVKILAGTDTYNSYCYPGFSLHDELELFVKAGLTPLEALQTATLNPARFLNLTRSLGTIEKGKIADLVLLEANPLVSIGNTRKIAGVVVNGRYLPQQSLQKILTDVEVIANKN